MNQPTREEFEQFKQEIRQEVRQQIREQVTEEIKVTRVEIVSEDALKRLESINEKLDQQSKRFDHIDGLLLAHSRNISTLQTDVSTLQTDVSTIKETMATKEYIEKRFDSIAEVQKLILDRLPKPPERND